jgi:hypothetical protein
MGRDRDINVFYCSTLHCCCHKAFLLLTNLSVSHFPFPFYSRPSLFLLTFIVPGHSFSLYSHGKHFYIPGPSRLLPRLVPGGLYSHGKHFLYSRAQQTAAQAGPWGLYSHGKHFLYSRAQQTAAQAGSWGVI